jgi:hypothetical protein
MNNPVRAAAAAALAAALLAGCGPPRPPGGVDLTVTRDFGAAAVLDRPDPSRTAGDTLLALAERNAPVRARGQAWSVYVNGVDATRQAAARRVRDGDRIWWDRHALAAAPRVPAVIGSYPEPFLHGTAGRRLPVRVECASAAADRTACRAVARALGRSGIVAGQSAIGSGVGPEVLRVLVGPWSALRADEAAQLLEQGPRGSGVYARISADGRSVDALDARGHTARTLRAGTGLIAATRAPSQQPTWIVTGTDAAGLDSAVRAFSDGQSALEGKFALAVSADRAIALPITSTRLSRP